ncbi:hypothetical protein FJ976_17335 [Mesorhizobium sp. B1-1-9]|uniref:hypothetical protein n=1 Tax=Mesorhizobium sp. B1-1-9 TaxID=2589975 RepID=UPI0011269AEC|nr:hypothetical protein [Mesorhizobium sp. B1-1-9]TPN49492.1 hypothetical protein FJ976_17335 [Mesorhizobium sp. B1-1-9]
MRAELLPALPATWSEVWLPLSRHAECPSDIFVLLVEHLIDPPFAPVQPPLPQPEAFDVDGRLSDPLAIEARDHYEAASKKFAKERSDYESALTSEHLAKVYFRAFLRSALEEPVAVSIVEDALDAIKSTNSEALVIRYMALVKKFLLRYNLRYEARGSLRLHATIPGLFIKMLAEVKQIASNDTHLSNLVEDFEEAFADMKVERTQAKMKTCLQKQFNLLEGLGSQCPGITEATLGAMCNQIDWPHATLKEVGKKLYGFGSNYPGVRHAGSPQGVLRHLEMKDFVSLSLMLVSLTPYLTGGLDSELCYTA